MVFNLRRALDENEDEWMLDLNRGYIVDFDWSNDIAIFHSAGHTQLRRWIEEIEKPLGGNSYKLVEVKKGVVGMTCPISIIQFNLQKPVPEEDRVIEYYGDGESDIVSLSEEAELHVFSKQLQRYKPGKVRGKRAFDMKHKVGGLGLSKNTLYYDEIGDRGMMLRDVYLASEHRWNHLFKNSPDQEVKQIFLQKIWEHVTNPDFVHMIY